MLAPEERLSMRNPALPAMSRVSRSTSAWAGRLSTNIAVNIASRPASTSSQAASTKRSRRSARRMSLVVPVKEFMPHTPGRLPVE